MNTNDPSSRLTSYYRQVDQMPVDTAIFSVEGVRRMARRRRGQAAAVTAIAVAVTGVLTVTATLSLGSASDRHGVAASTGTIRQLKQAVDVREVAYSQAGPCVDGRVGPRTAYRTRSNPATRWVTPVAAMPMLIGRPECVDVGKPLMKLNSVTGARVERDVITPRIWHVVLTLTRSDVDALRTIISVYDGQSFAWTSQGKVLSTAVVLRPFSGSDAAITNETSQAQARAVLATLVGAPPGGIGR